MHVFCPDETQQYQAALYRPRLPLCNFTFTVIDYIAGGWTMVGISVFFFYLFSFNFRFNMLNLLLLSEQIMMSCGVYAVCHFKCICHGRQKFDKNKMYIFLIGVKRVGEKKEEKRNRY